VDRGNRYHDQSGIEARISALVQGYPALAHNFSIGTSVEGRSIHALRISSTPGENVAAKPEIVLTGVHHAREWISAEVPMGIAELLCVQYYANARVRAMVDAVEFIIVPVVNPDGYIHSHGGSRYWRKNRRVNADETVGVDLNRNYPTYWGDLMGASATPSDDTYHGPSAASEPETQAVMALMRNTAYVSAPTFFVSYHNYGSEVLYPFGNTANNMSPIDALLGNISRHLAEVVMPASPQGERYNAYKASGLYPVSGDTVDWVHANFRHVPAVTIELRPTLNGCCGFELPVAQLNATVLENAAAVFFAAEYAVASMALPQAGTYWWHSVGAAGTFDASRVAPIDADHNGVPDWFDRCSGAGLLTASAAYPLSSDEHASKFEWPPLVSHSVGELRGTSCQQSTEAAYSVLGVDAGVSRWLRLTLIPAPSDAAAADTAAIGTSLRNADCALGSNDAALAAAIRRRVEAAVGIWHTSAVPTAMAVELRNASWQRSSVRIKCMVDFRLTGLQAPGASGSVDVVFAAVYAASYGGNFTGFTDEAAAVDDVQLALDPFRFSSNPPFTAAATAPATTSAAAGPDGVPTTTTAGQTPVPPATPSQPLLSNSHSVGFHKAALLVMVAGLVAAFA